MTGSSGQGSRIRRIRLLGIDSSMDDISKEEENSDSRVPCLSLLLADEGMISGRLRGLLRGKDTRNLSKSPNVGVRARAGGGNSSSIPRFVSRFTNPCTLSNHILASFTQSTHHTEIELMSANSKEVSHLHAKRLGSETDLTRRQLYSPPDTNI